MHKILVFLTLIVFSLASAETGPLGFGKATFERELTSDRPDFTESAQTIEPGHVQFEAGYTYTQDEVTSHTVPELLVRSGISENTELRLVWSGFIQEQAGGVETDGVSDLAIGFKHQLSPETGDLPALSALFELGLPVGSSEFSSDDPEIVVKFLTERGLTESFGLAGNLNFASIKEGNEYILETSASLSAGYALTDTVASYLEYYGLYPSQSISGPAHTVNGGLTFLIDPNVQLDVRAGFGLNGNADDFLTGTGIVFRF